MSLETRKITDAGFPEWQRAVAVGFLRPSLRLSDEAVEARRAQFRESRMTGAYDDGRCVATYRSFDQRLTVVGGATVAADAISQVTVTTTHRRRGLLGRLITADLAEARERGDTVATLIAAEYPIYGRYGFGPATRTTEWTLDLLRSGLDRRSAVPDDGGRIDFVDGEEVRKLGPALHSALAARRAGVVSRDEVWWETATGSAPHPIFPWTEPFYALYRSPSGEPEGLAVYEADDTWGDGKQPQNTATVRDLLALTPAAARALWHHVCSVDWVTSVKSGRRAPDDLLPDLLPDPRAALVTTAADYLWVRMLDTAAALEARTYDTAATLVLEVHDGLGLASGRYRLETGPSGASCAPTTASADLALDVRELGRLYLGDESALRLAALGAVEELRPGAAALAERVFRTPERPWCPDIF
jgi:predicted acetyltransferase